MIEDNVVKLKKPDVFVGDPIFDILHQDPRMLLNRVRTGAYRFIQACTITSAP